MAHTEKKATYTATNTYETLNELTSNTKNIWIVLHGIGYLSRYFLGYFDALNGNENYIIAPQAPSKYYLKNEYRHVGASWLTKENTAQETVNVLNYLDAVLVAENLPLDKKLIILGFSQGVSIAMRWVAHRKLKCDHLVLYAGGIPKELVTKDFDFLKEKKIKITTLVGDQDEYLTPEVMKGQLKRIEELFHGRAESIIFKGAHEIK
ncbi:esterase, partial [bacterium]|nr:esterase [bacterium]